MPSASQRTVSISLVAAGLCLAAVSVALFPAPSSASPRSRRPEVRLVDPGGDVPAPGDLRPVADGEKDGAALGGRMFTLAAPGPDGPFLLESPSVSLVLDAFGAFGTSTSGGAATFDDGTQRASTVYESMAHLRGVGFLDGDSQILPQSAAGAVRDGSAVVSSYGLGAWHVDLRSELLACAEPACAVLEQRYVLTNVSPAEADLVLTLYLDGDLFFAGAHGNDYGAVADGGVYEFDEGSDPLAPSTFLGLGSEAPAALRVAREVGEFSEQRRRIARDGLLMPDRLRRSSGVDADADGDGLTDTGFDVSLGVQHDFGTLAPGETVELVSRVRWGLGRLADLDAAPLADAGGNRSVDCDGPDGTVVTLDGSASTPDGALVRFDWSVDGEPAGSGEVLDVVLTPGPHAIALEVEDDAGRTDEDQATVEVADRTPPEAHVTGPLELWPPDHRLVPVSLPVTLADTCSDDVEISILAVTSDEPDEARAGGDGMRPVDAALDAEGRLLLRRERRGDGDGRVYRVLAVATDAAGNRTPFFAEVNVPHSRRGEDAIDSGVAARLLP